MSRLVRLGLPSVLVVAAFGCAPSPIGDPCIPESIPPTGFDDREIYLETSSVQCRTRVCMVYQLKGHPDQPCGPGANPETCVDPQRLETQIFCSCRCSTSAGGQANTPLCNCGDGYTCIDDVVTTGGAGVRGGYCVPCIRPGNPDGLLSPPFEPCPT